MYSTETHGAFGISTEIEDHANYHVSGAVGMKQVGSCYQSRRYRRKGREKIIKMPGARHVSKISLLRCLNRS